MNKKTLKKQLIHHRGHRCEGCLHVSWLNQPIPLQIHHINGDSHNNDNNNLQLLCPNCHAITPNYCGKNIKNPIKPKYNDEHICLLIPQSQSIRQIILTLGMPTSKAHYDRIRQLMRFHNLSLKPRAMTIEEVNRAFEQRRVVRPSKDDLTKLVWSKSRLILSQELGVSDKAIQKWCDFYGIPTPPRGFWSRSSAEREQIRQDMVPQVGFEPTTTSF